ncbi:MAG: AMP-binding protein [Deltaproteobacteria bacterium]|nr:MAG: AMP-binding protein [Deltaproteobacteria bacterium]
MLIGETLECNTEKYGNRLAMVDESGNRLTWSAFNARVNKLAHALLDRGIKKGDRVAMVSENCNQYAEVMFATSKIGAIMAPLNYRLTEQQLSLAIDDCQPKAFFVQNKFHGLINSMQSHLKSVESYVGLGAGHGYSYDYESLIIPYSEHDPQVDLNEDDAHMIVFSTGTTGSSKGVAITHRQRILGALGTAMNMAISLDEIVLIGQPLFVIGGQAWLFAAFIKGAASAIHAFSGKSFAEMIEKEKVTSFSVSPARYQIIREYLDTCGRSYDFGSVRYLRISGGQPCPSKKLKEIADYFKIYDVGKLYGMTEVPSGGTCLLPEEAAPALRPGATEKEIRRLDSVGKPTFFNRLRIVGENDQDLPPGKIGEVLLKGDLVNTRCYWNHPELNERAFKNGWFYTSDLGFLDEDGFFYFVERKDSMIKSGGFFVAAKEVEKVILQHPAVSEVAVVGIPDDRWGQMVKAAVVLKHGQSVSEEDLKTHCRKYLARYQVPKSMRFVPQIPKEPTYGKILMPQLKQLLHS